MSEHKTGEPVQEHIYWDPRYRADGRVMDHTDNYTKVWGRVRIPINDQVEHVREQIHLQIMEDLKK